MSDEWIGEAYDVGFWVTWVLTFLIVWIICSLEGGMIGFCLGWMPAIIIVTVSTPPLEFAGESRQER